ncbi:MAG TPA: UbiA family prenyltransferase [Verrucomicrobiae bacterium]|nr:UbiA family prenyltransferase [Verrucomicrobiae bacterium]
MARLRDYLELCRVSNLPTVWTNVLAAAVLAGASTSWGTLFPLAALSLLYCAGMALNDCCDAPEDARLRPERPVPSGRVTRAAAGTFAALLAAAALVLLGLSPHPSAAAAGLLLALVIAAYDLLHSRTPLSVLLMAACRFGCYGVTAVAVSGQLPAAAAAGGMVQFLYVLLLTVVARREKRRGEGRSRVPAMLCGIPLVDGAVSLAAGTPYVLPAALAASAATAAGQRLFRGD